MAVQFRDYYEVLGVARDAGQDDIRKAFRKLARKYHPDVAEDKVAGEAKFKELNEAYEVLSDPAKRRKYDALGPNWQHGADFSQAARGAGTGGGFDYEDHGGFGGGQGGGYEFHFGGSTGFSDFFENLFGRPAGGGGRGARAAAGGAGMQRRGRDVEADILVSLEEVLHGSERPLSLQKPRPDGGMETKSVRIRIPRGIAAGQFIRCAGLGEPGTDGGEAGDLFLRVHLERHPYLRVDGHDLYYDLLLAPWEAALGTEVEIPALHRNLRIRVPADTVSGTELRLAGKGLPTGTSGSTGDLYAVVDIVMPGHSTPSEQALWKQLSELSRFNPRA